MFLSKCRIGCAQEHCHESNIPDSYLSSDQATEDRTHKGNFSRQANLPKLTPGDAQQTPQFNPSINLELAHELKQQHLEIKTPMPRRCATEEFACPLPLIEDGHPDAESRAITACDAVEAKMQP